MNSYRIKGTPFLLWWMACTLFVYPMALTLGALVMFPLLMGIGFLEPNLSDYEVLFTLLALALVVPTGGAVVGFCAGQLQRWLLRTRLYWVAERWRLWSMAGGAVGSVALTLLVLVAPDYLYEDLRLLLVLMPAFALCLSAVQWMSLRHVVHQAWLWVLGNLAAGVVFAGLIVMNTPPIYEYGYETSVIGLWFVATLAQGAITGLVILYLFEKHLKPLEVDGAEAEKPASVWDNAI